MPKLLDILVPTYNRPDCIMRLLDDISDLTDSRVRVLINSNGPLGEKYDLQCSNANVKLTFFSENLGAAANFQFLLERSSAKYAMFLSDEDSLNLDNLDHVLKLLEDAQNDVLIFNTYKESGIPLYRSFPNYGKSMNFKKALLLGMDRTTYMSGYAFRREVLTTDFIRESFVNSPGNVYYHINLLDFLLEAGGTVKAIDFPFVIKGDEAESGGDAYDFSKKEAGDIGLNPRIYSAAARFCQRGFRYRFINNLNVPRSWKYLYQWHNYLFFEERIIYSLQRGDKLLENTPREKMLNYIRLNHFDFYVKFINGLLKINRYLWKVH